MSRAMLRLGGHDMKKLGIVGRVGWVGTLDYYRMICTLSGAHFRARGHSAPLPTPPITIESIVMAEARKVRRLPSAAEADWAAYDAMFRDAVLRLQAAGCDVAIIASNTPHSRLHAIRRGIAIPVLSILTETARAVARTGAERALILGTEVIMHGDDYGGALRAKGVAPNDPLPPNRIAEVQSLIDHEFQQGAFEAGRKRLVEIATAHGGAGPGRAVVLACTDFSPAFAEQAEAPVFEADGITFVNSTAVHAAAAFDAVLEGA